MKNIFFKTVFCINAVATCLLLTVQVYAQGKNEIAVRNGEGKNIEGVTVYILDAATLHCQCILGFCSPKLVDSDVTDKNGLAKFHGGKHKLNAKTEYYASIDASCKLSQQSQECRNPQIDCMSFVSTQKFTTDDKGKFTGFEIKK